VLSRAAFTAAISPTNVFPDDVGENTIRFPAPKSPNSFTARSCTGRSSGPIVSRQMASTSGAMW